MNIKLLYEAAKHFVDTYEHERHERRHEAQAVPVNWSGEKDNAYHDLTEAIFNRATLTTIQKAAITFADICNREEREKKPKLDRAWSPEKHQAYHRLLDDFIGHKHYDEIVADARRYRKGEHRYKTCWDMHISEPQYYKLLGKFLSTAKAVHEKFFAAE